MTYHGYHNPDESNPSVDLELALEVSRERASLYVDIGESLILTKALSAGVAAKGLIFSLILKSWDQGMQTNITAAGDIIHSASLRRGLRPEDQPDDVRGELTLHYTNQKSGVHYKGSGLDLRNFGDSSYFFDARGDILKRGEESTKKLGWLAAHRLCGHLQKMDLVSEPFRNLPRGQNTDPS